LSGESDNKGKESRSERKCGVSYRNREHFGDLAQRRGGVSLRTDLNKISIYKGKK